MANLTNFIMGGKQCVDFDFSDFKNGKAFFLQQAKWQYDLAVSEFRRNAKDLIMAHKDDIFAFICKLIFAIILFLIAQILHQPG